MLALCFGGSRATVFLPEQYRSTARVWCKHGLHRGKAAAWLPHSIGKSEIVFDIDPVVAE